MKTLYQKAAFYFLITLFAFLGFSCTSKIEISERNIDFNGEWKFRIAELEDAHNPEFDDSSWKTVDLPHDWSTEDYNLQDSLHVGPFFKNEPRGADIGYLRTGTCWYRKEWKTPKGLGENQVILNFDGVQTQMELWINGKLVGENMYGYSPLNFNITEYLNKSGKTNVLAVKTVNSGENSRWFAGGGIYRPVRISILHPVSVADWGLFVTTPAVTKSQATINYQVKINNFSAETQNIRFEAIATGPDEQVIEIGSGSEKIESPGVTINVNGSIDNPQLWEIDNPHLYRAVIKLFIDEELKDEYTTTFGIRSIEYSAGTGFLLNGREILMKGACLHHDNGILGAAAFRDAEYRRVRIMKENGFNAIRTSHNPPSEDFLNACDEYGMLVIDEAFDHWVKPKRPNDYSNYFEEWYKKDIQAMVLRDRNHPGIVMWSFGNEVQERADPEGIEVGKKLIAAIKEYDTTRPVTQAICGFWDNPGREWDYSAGAFEICDIGGYNYQYQQYESDHLKYPERIMYGSEAVAMQAWEHWEMVKKHSYVIGDFVWTGMDYIGESGIGHTIRSEDPNAKAHGLQPWPWYNAWCGDIDLTGNKKPQSFYRDVVWGESRLEMLVQRPMEEGFTEITSFWGWPEEMKSWTWPGSDNKKMKVRVYSSYPKVRLELNGNTIGEKVIRSKDKYIAEFSVPYQPGTLKAIGLSGDSILESQILRTAGALKNINLVPESNELRADRNSLIYIQVEARDETGTLLPDASTSLTVEVSGAAELLAAGNASPTLQGSFRDASFELFRGRGLIIIRSTGTHGEAHVKVSGEEVIAEWGVESEE